MVGFLFYELVGRSFQQVSCQRIYFLYLKQNQVITQSVGCNPIVRIFGRSKYRPALVLGDAKGLAPNFKNRPRAKGRGGLQGIFTGNQTSTGMRHVVGKAL